MPRPFQNPTPAQKWTITVPSILYYWDCPSIKINTHPITLLVCGFHQCAREPKGMVLSNVDKVITFNSSARMSVPSGSTRRIDSLILCC